MFNRVHEDIDGKTGFSGLVDVFTLYMTLN